MQYPNQLLSGARVVSQMALNLIKGRVLGYKPFFLSHLVTARCNFFCGGCLWKDNSADSMSLEEIRVLYTQAKACGFIANYIWGGEPLLRKDIAEILRCSKEHGFLTLLNTNAWFLKDRLPGLAPNLDVLIISLDHSTAAGHDGIRGLKGSYDRILEVIPLIKSRYPGIRLIVNSIVLKENHDDIDNILELWKRLGVWGYMNFIEVDLLTSEGLGDQNAEVDVSERGRCELARRLIDRKRDGYPILNTYDYFNTFVAGKKPYRCHFPKIFLEVYPDGSVLDCVRVDKPVGNVRQTPLEQILKRPRIQGMIDDGERWCHVHNNADRIDTSNTWELRPQSVATGLRFMLRGTGAP